MTDNNDFQGAAEAIAALDHLDVPALEVMYRLELTSARFYDLLVERVDDERASELLRRNGREEVGHARRVGRAIGIKQGHDFEPSAELEERYPVELPPTIGLLDLLSNLVRGERTGDDDYQRWADAERDPAVARLLRLSGREETIHAERVTEVIEILGLSEGERE